MSHIQCLKKSIKGSENLIFFFYLIKVIISVVFKKVPVMAFVSLFHHEERYRKSRNYVLDAFLIFSLYSRIRPRRDVFSSTNFLKQSKRYEKFRFI